MSGRLLAWLGYMTAKSMPSSSMRSARSLGKEAAARSRVFLAGWPHHAGTDVQVRCRSSLDMPIQRSATEVR